jgi:hypothetical protein
LHQSLPTENGRTFYLRMFQLNRSFHFIDQALDELAARFSKT